MATITSTSANETLTGSAANDSYVFSNGFGLDSISDAGGTDTVNMAAVTANLTINLTAGAGDEITDGTNTVNWTGNIIERATGGSGNDSITGNSAINVLNGSAGDDTLSGLGGDDTLYGGTGNDSLDGGDGFDVYLFESGWNNDTITADSSGGYDQVDFSLLTSNMTVNLTAGAGIEATDGTSTLEIAGDFIEQVKGGSGHDTITGNSLNNAVWGYYGDDTISTGSGSDILDGNNGNDSLDGGDGVDRYIFGAGGFGTANWGNDVIVDSSGSDEVYLVGVSNNLTINLNAGAGDEVTDGINTVNWTGNIIENATGGSGNDSITGDSSNNNLTGNDGNDTLSGEDGNDSLIGGNGNDSLIGGNGNDTLRGENGNDSLDGGDGNDSYLFYNTWGSHVITGDNSGTDQVYLANVTSNLTINLTAGAGDEIADGLNTVNWTGDIIEIAATGSGNDLITGNSSGNTLTGGAGNDTISGGDGNDALYGSNDNDFLDGGNGNDNLYGGSGNDTYVFSESWGNDIISNQAIDGEIGGNDTVDLSTVTANVTVNLLSGTGNEVTDGTNTVNWSSDVIENATTGSGADSLTGNALDNNLDAGGDNDTITAGDGNDTLTGGSGDDSLDGGAGNDTYVFGDNFGYDTINDSSGIDTIDLSGTTVHYDIDLRAYNAASIAQGTGYINRVWQTSTTVLENAYAGSADDTVVGNDSDNYLSGGAGNDLLQGNLGNDTLVGGDGNDSLYTTDSGNDSLIGGNGNDIIADVGYGSDTVDSGAGNDHISIGWTDRLYLTDTSGTDSLLLNFGNPYLGHAMTYDAVAGTIKNGSTVFASWDPTTTYFETIYASDLDDTVIGGAGNDTLYGHQGSDTMTGGSGDDVLYGSYGNLQTGHLDVYENDTLDGGDGNDYLDGQAWHDSLTGGSGNDSLIGGIGNDTLSGGDGNDTYKFSYYLDYFYTDVDVLQDSSGTDTLDFSTNAWDNAMTINLTSGAGSEAYVTAESGRNLNWSGDAIENIIGSMAADSITGSSVANNLDGYLGSDTIAGMGGNDTLQGGTGNDIYQFAQGDGQDLIIENDTTGGNSDKIAFNSSVSQSVVAVFQTGSGDLQIGYTNSAGDLITVQDFDTAAGAVERFELSTGYYMTDSEINQVISDMAAYATTNSVSFTSLDDVKNDAGLLAIVNGGWHT